MADPRPAPPDATDAPARLFPLFADLRGRRVLVVGGGAVARRKVEALDGTGARVVVGAPALEPALAAQRDAGALDHLAGTFDASWLAGAWLVIAATDDAAVNATVAEAADARGLWVNVVDDLARARFHVPARVERGPLQVAISSGGGAPMLARLVREDLEARFDASFGALATLLATQRDRIRARWPGLAARRRGYAALLAGPLRDLLRRGRDDDARALLDAELRDGARPRTLDDAREAATPRGSVALVGAGPGDPGLLTLRALRVLNEADVILHDALVDDAVLQLARRDADRIAVGKRAGAHSVPQDETNALMLRLAREGHRVVRLKGGDPFVFGRGGEELELLRANGIDAEVVPGITAAVACAAYAGVPLTHRDHAQSVRLVTAHARDSLDSLDWRALAQERQTLAVYMGVGLLETLQARLLAHGRAATTPFALVENGSRPEQRVVTGTLATLVERARAHAVQAPALLIVGEVAAFADTLHWFGAAPLGAPGGDGIEAAAAPITPVAEALDAAA